MNKKTAALIASDSIAELGGTDTERPLIALNSELSVGYLGFEGLEFETPDFYQVEISKAGSKKAWIHEVFDPTTMWRQRLNLATISIDRIIDSRRLS